MMIRPIALVASLLILPLVSMTNHDQKNRESITVVNAPAIRVQQPTTKEVIQLEEIREVVQPVRTETIIVSNQNQKNHHKSKNQGQQIVVQEVVRHQSAPTIIQRQPQTIVERPVQLIQPVEYVDRPVIREVIRDRPVHYVEEVVKHVPVSTQQRVEVIETRPQTLQFPSISLPSFSSLTPSLPKITHPKHWFKQQPERIIVSQPVIVERPVVVDRPTTTTTRKPCNRGCNL